VLACTAAVERTVHRHLSEQISYLTAHDPELANIVQSIQVEENDHLEFAEARLNTKALGVRLLSGAVATATEIMILLSTRGDSLRLRAALKSAA